MLWKDFKKEVEEQGVTDDTGIFWVDYSTDFPIGVRVKWPKEHKGFVMIEGGDWDPNE